MMWRLSSSEDEADKEGEAGNPLGLAMEPDAVS